MSQDQRKRVTQALATAMVELQKVIDEEDEQRPRYMSRPGWLTLTANINGQMAAAAKRISDQ